MCFFNTAEQAYLEQIECFPPLKTLLGRQYSFQKLTQFSQGNNMLDAPPSNLGGFPSKDPCVYSIELNRPMWKKMSVPHLCNP
jgi:hypothetical protein